MPINSKNKGSDYERKIAKALSDWSGREFTRTPGSGGLHWKENNTVSGDIVPPADMLKTFIMSVELKKQEVPWDFDFILKGTSDLLKFYAQCERDAEMFGKTPMLIFSKNRRLDYVMTTVEWFYGVGLEDHLPHAVFKLAPFGELAVFSFQDMLEFTTLKDFTGPSF